MASYLINSLVHHLVGFFYDWYVRSFYSVFSKAFGIIRYLEKTIALKVTFQYWLEPLYQDYTFLGYLLGFPARTIRLFFGAAAYILILIAFALAYLLWSVLLPILIYRTI